MPNKVDSDIVISYLKQLCTEKSGVCHGFDWNGPNSGWWVNGQVFDSAGWNVLVKANDDCASFTNPACS